MDPNAMMSLMLPLIIIIVGVSMVLQILSMFTPFIQGRQRRNYIERPNDAFQSIYKRRRKAAKQNLKDSNLKRLVCMGERDHYSLDYGHLYGLAWHRDVIEVFWRPRRTSGARWGIIPRELARDPLGRTFRVKCNGFAPLGNFYRPIYSSDTPPELQEEYDKVISDWVEQMFDWEKSYELEEQGVHTMEDALDVHHQATRFIRRQDTIPATARSGEPEPERYSYDEDEW